VSIYIVYIYRRIVVFVVTNLDILFRCIGVKIAISGVAIIKAFIIKAFVARDFASCCLIARLIAAGRSQVKGYILSGNWRGGVVAGSAT
jgi:hypothetical protein